MTRTKLSVPNVALLLLGVTVSLLDAFLSVMTAGFGADPVHDVKSAAMTVVILASLALLPSSLIAFWWSRIGVVVSWSIFRLCSLCVLIGGAWGGMVFLVLSFVQALITTSIDSRGEEHPNADVAPG
jgi:hypothetical protein